MPTLSSLLETLTARGVVPAGRTKDLRTSLRYLAHALGAESPEQCPVDGTLAEEARWGPTLEDHFHGLDRGVSAITRRNTRTNLRWILRRARALSLLDGPRPLPLLAPAAQEGVMDSRRLYHESSPYRTTYARPQASRYALPYDQWPPDCQDGWERYRATVLHHREATLHHAVVLLTTVFGWRRHIVGQTPAWEDLFNVTLLTAFTRWHAARVGQRRLSGHGWNVVIKVAAIAKAIEHPNARALAEWRNKQPAVTVMHKERHHDLTLPELEQVADALLTEGRKPYLYRGRDRMRSRKDTGSPGLQRAMRFQKGLILKLLIRVPLRQRNIREMEYDRNLYQEKGHWWIRFEGDDLKIGKRGPKPNVYALDLTARCAELIPLFDEYRREFRPRIPHAAESPHVFLSSVGRPFSANSLGHELSHAVARLVGNDKRFYPHLIRHLWATEYLEDTQNYAGAAVMLGDTLKVVMDSYYTIKDEAQQERATTWLRDKLGG